MNIKTDANREGVLMRVTKRAFIGKTIAIGALILLTLILCLLKNNVAVSEWWTKNVARAIIWLNGHIFGVLPFSMFELAIVLVIVGFIAWIVYSILLLRRHNFPKVLSLLMTVVIVITSALNIYIMSASFGYNRAPLDLHYYKVSESGALEYGEVRKMVTAFIKDFNELAKKMQRDEKGLTISPYTAQKLNELLIEEYKRLDSDYFNSYTPATKAIINKTIMSELHILGVFFAPFGEPNYNVNTFTTQLSVTMAHEMAHSKGVMRESEADVVANYLCMTSSNDFLRYCAYLDVYNNVLDLLLYYWDGINEYKDIVNTLHSGIKADKFAASRSFSQYRLLTDLGNTLNNWYLMLNGRDGANDYSDTGNVVVPQPPVDTDPTKPIKPQPIIIHSYSITQGIFIELYRNGNGG